MHNKDPRAKIYRLYRHTSPHGKVYIGITSQAKPEYRWGPDGSGYQSNTLFWHDIQKYGWDSFKHEVLAEELTQNEALKLESSLIHEHRATKPEFGYNQDAGCLYPDEDSSLTKLKRHFSGKANWEANQRFGSMKKLSCDLKKVKRK